MLRYELSNKFWEVDIHGATLTTTTGRKPSVKKLASIEECQQAYGKLVAEKTAQGYVPVGDPAKAAKPKAGEPPRPKTVPAEATYDAENEQWELGATAKGKRTGAWQFWWRTTGHLCAISEYSENGSVEKYTRFHPDGTLSKQATEVKGKMTGPAIYQKSKNPTTELVLTNKPYTHPEVFRCTIEDTVKGWGVNWRYYNAKGVRVDLEGHPLMTDAELAKSLDGHTPPADLLKLLEFQRLWGIEMFADGFAIVQDDKSLFEIWSKDKNFLSALVPLASANGTGSVYAFWLDGKQTDLAKVPIVIFGDEGGEYVIAENLRGLLAILSADTEPSVWPRDDDDAAGLSITFNTEDRTGSYHAATFRKWLKSEFGIAPVKNPEKLVKQAQAKLQPRFAAWVAKFAKR